jgi:hypothetical protein
MTAQGKKPPKKKRTARKKRWGPAKPPQQKVDEERLKPISLHPLDFETAVRGLLGPIIGRKTKPRPE